MALPRAARASGGSASGLSDAVRRLEAKLGVRLLNRTTRSVVPTEQGKKLLDRLQPALAEMRAAIEAVAESGDQPAGALRLNVPANAARLILPMIVPPFLARYPDIRLEVTTDSSLVDMLAAGCDAGIRYDDRLQQDMIAVAIGPRKQRFATVASSHYLDRHGRPEHPRDLLRHVCLRSRSSNGRSAPWQFERNGEVVRIDPKGCLTFGTGSAVDLAVATAIGGVGILHLFEDWVGPAIASGQLEPILTPWWQTFSGPYLYYPGHRLVPAPLRAFIDFVKAMPD